jgi:hypothetical protein
MSVNPLQAQPQPVAEIVPNSQEFVIGGYTVGTKTFDQSCSGTTRARS